jgi:ABC-type nitrate/sulfonate/bicarbonate transport system substrate-binding protein
MFWLLALVALLASTSYGQRGPETKKISFRLAWVADMAEVGVFVAKEKGYFKREGLEVEIQPGGFGLDPLKLVAAGSNDFGIGGAGNLLLARERGLPVVAIAAEFQTTPVGFVTRKDSGITTFAQFRGKRVGIQTGADTDVLYRALLVRHGMKPTDVKEVPIQYDMGPFVNNIIDVLPAYVTNQPITLRSQGIEVNVITAASQGVRYYGNIFFTTSDMLKKNPDTVRRFVRAVHDGWSHALSNQADAITALEAFTKEFKPADLDKIYDAVMPFIRPDEQNVPLLGMTRGRWESTYQVLKDAGLSQSPQPVEQAYTAEFISAQK